MGLTNTKNTYSRIQEIVSTNLNIVHQEVRRIFKRGQSEFEYDDLVQIGVIGLMEAASRFDESYSISFSSYARLRVRGAIIDELRKNDWVPRSVRQRAQQIQENKNQLTHTLGRKPTNKELSAKLNIKQEQYQSFQKYAQIRIVVSMDEGEHPPREMIASKTKSPSEALLHNEQIKEMMKSISTLSEQEQKLIQLYYFEGLDMKEIAVAFQVSASRISQMHNKLLSRLHTKLKRVL